MANRIDDLREPLKTARNWGSGRDGVHHFIWQRVTAILIGLCALWLLGIALTLRSASYEIIHGLVADPLNATVLILFLVSVFWHAKLGLQVVIEDYVHTPINGVVLHLLTILVCALAGIASVLAVLRIALGS
ncbi:succinate dehydrogenase, hydrophobic membrane anchor protein [Thermomonas sp.]|uniref:succinate dehydrogenase, hydrophobic membrane anchor protein n=1 Tax=Thermomonas sp. TaxID=1971895 RepID=UPI001DBA26B7|nr:succinate dehydrogenase, hydrophobic membrane anchor protein [Thermomonas sp.]MBZ0088116.1 succinate dehydrogenase, hydrophobic membrane anchor protein [Thermomonas sp.]MCO5054546.1 succinate dehydrogenase, hydrophobic membrane anchor protein [Thermomonas sp.]MCW5577330.1 succinate dehydrogenase, hydrophobic membrane anchor protein [Dokdonella sp.]HRO63928.1 succinate dehydrogenase, hydrophobic membrane anchor protein [Thermomonas sp.]